MYDNRCRRYIKKKLFVKWHFVLCIKKMYLVCPILCILPTACNSLAGFRVGSTRMTCVASMIFNPLAPSFSGNSSTLMLGRDLKAAKLA